MTLAELENHSALRQLSTNNHAMMTERRWSDWIKWFVNSRRPHIAPVRRIMNETRAKSCVWAIACSGTIALIGFIIGFTTSLFVTEATTWAHRFAMASMISVIPLIAALLLFGRDGARRPGIMCSVRSHLLSCDDSSDLEFLSSIPYASTPCDDVALLLETRTAISKFFDVSGNKVPRNVHLIDDLHVDKLKPSFQLFVVDSVVASQSVEPRPQLFTFAMAGLNSIDDLTQAIRKLIDAFDLNDETEGQGEAS